MSLFNSSQMAKINEVAERTKQLNKEKPKAVRVSTVNAELNEMSKAVQEYFKDSKAILIRTKEQLHEYVTNCIEAGYAGIDTETTGLDRQNDWIVGASLYYPGGVECYIPMKHLVPIFESPYKGQLTYEEVSEEFKRMENSNIRLIFANADYDLAMIYKDLKVDFCDRFYYDVILAWRCLKENELHNDLKFLYNKYVLKGKGDPKRFSDFFSVKLFPFSDPEIAKLYAANDAKITYDLFKWQLPYVTESHPKCQKANLQAISRLIWDLEMPMVKVCQNMHRTGMYIDKNVANALKKRYRNEYNKEMKKLQDMVQEIIDNSTVSYSGKRPFTRGVDFNPSSPPQVKYLVYDLLQVPKGNSSGTGKEVLNEINLPVTNQILKVRSLSVLINTFVDKLPNSVARDGRIHGQFKQIGADCIVGDTIIPTSSGYYTAAELCESAKMLPETHVPISDISIVNMYQCDEIADSVIYYHDFDTIKITTEHGFVIEGTPNHPVVVSKYTNRDKHILYDDVKLSSIWEGRYFKCLSDIEVGDIIEIPCNYFSCNQSDYVNTRFELKPDYNNMRPDVKVPEIYDEDFALFLGMYHADGSAYFRDGSYTISISNDDIDVINCVDSLSMKLFNIQTSHYTAQKDKNEVETYINCRRISSIDSILSHGKQNKRIPSSIWKSPTSVINAYIRGMTLDSSVHIEKSTGRAEFELSIINEVDARLVQVHLASQGILAGWGYNQNKGFASPRLKMNADNYLRFCDVIGLIESRKYLHTEGCKKNPYRRRRICDSFRVSVKKIEYGNQDVYDLHVPNSHSFIANGMISHNTGRMSSAEPNLQNIPSHAVDIRHMFRATPGYVMLGSDFSQQEPKLTAFVGDIKEMCEGFAHGKDAYALIASVSFNMPYEKCLEFHPDTHEYQPDGKARRSEAKSILLGERRSYAPYFKFSH